MEKDIFTEGKGEKVIYNPYKDAKFEKIKPPKLREIKGINLPKWFPWTLTISLFIVTLTLILGTIYSQIKF